MNDLAQLAAGDHARHKQHGVDLNPFSTLAARSLWQWGYAGKPFPDLYGSIGSQNWRIWERGRQARLLVEQQP